MKEETRPRLGLLSEDQVFGDRRIGLIQRLGTRTAVSDFAVLSGADISDSEHTEDDPSGRGRTGRWALSSAAGGGDVCVVNASGERRVSYANAREGMRPVMECEDPSRLEGQVREDISGFTEVLYGEYPQYVTDRQTARQLESEYAAGSLRMTGKWYEAEHEEYIFREHKYIRAAYSAERPRQLSDGRVYKKDDFLWLQVEPVRWLWDPGARLLVSQTVISCGPGFRSGNYYDGAFEETEAYHFLNTAFAEGLVPSMVREMTGEERKQYEEEMKEKAKKRNPYGLTFGQVSEEDIIRGAIESDIAVFLHGPSSEGKSARVKQIDPTCEIIYLRNATPDSLNGRSVYNQSTGEMIDIPPTWYKKVKAKCEAEPDKFHVVFFDEINNALPSIQGMAFNIVLDREVNGLWKLPPNARVVAAGNDMQDSLAANQIAAPFFNRFAHVYIETTTEKWLQWARKNQIHPAIYSFIAYKKGESLRSRYDGIKPNADPRKWEMASRMLYATGQPEMLRALIGEEITDEFVQFCSQPVITLEKVIKGDYTEEEVRALNTSERYATTMGLSQANEEELEPAREFVQRLGTEFLAVFDTLRSAR